MGSSTRNPRECLRQRSTRQKSLCFCQVSWALDVRYWLISDLPSLLIALLFLVPPQRLRSWRLSALFHHTPHPPKGGDMEREGNRLSGLCCGEVRPNPDSGANGERPFLKNRQSPGGRRRKGGWMKARSGHSQSAKRLRGVVLCHPAFQVMSAPTHKGYPVGLGLHGI